MEADRRAERTSSVTVVVAWVVVTIPLLWGVYQTLDKSRPLFDRSAARVPARTAPL